MPLPSDPFRPLYPLRDILPSVYAKMAEPFPPPLKLKHDFRATFDRVQLVRVLRALRRYESWDRTTPEWAFEKGDRVKAPHVNATMNRQELERRIAYLYSILPPMPEETMKKSPDGKTTSWSRSRSLVETDNVFITTKNGQIRWDVFNFENYCRITFGEISDGDADTESPIAVLARPLLEWLGSVKSKTVELTFTPDEVKLRADRHTGSVKRAGKLVEYTAKTQETVGSSASACTYVFDPKHFYETVEKASICSDRKHGMIWARGTHFEFPGGFDQGSDLDYVRVSSIDGVQMATFKLQHASAMGNLQEGDDTHYLIVPEVAIRKFLATKSITGKDDMISMTFDVKAGTVVFVAGSVQLSSPLIETKFRYRHGQFDVPDAEPHYGIVADHSELLALVRSADAFARNGWYGERVSVKIKVVDSDDYNDVSALVTLPELGELTATLPIARLKGFDIFEQDVSLNPGLFEHLLKADDASGEVAILRNGDKTPICITRTTDRAEGFYLMPTGV